jgi:hypothetical protein
MLSGQESDHLTILLISRWALHNSPQPRVGSFDVEQMFFHWVGFAIGMLQLICRKWGKIGFILQARKACLWHTRSVFLFISIDEGLHRFCMISRGNKFCAATSSK